jgi:Transmembrane proteins 14C
VLSFLRGTESTDPDPPSATHFNPYIGLILINGDFSQGSETPAYILSALVSVGGIIGYARTGSIPSITAGLTVGALVSIHPPSFLHPHLHICVRSSHINAISMG